MVFGILASILLFASTYLCFVRLLRYPRNWLPPAWTEALLTTALPWTEALLTTALAVCTVAHVGLSPNGIDGAASALVAFFVIGLFYVIAAPAIAFRPASRPIASLAPLPEGWASLVISGPRRYNRFSRPEAVIRPSRDGRTSNKTNRVFCCC